MGFLFIFSSTKGCLRANTSLTGPRRPASPRATSTRCRLLLRPLASGARIGTGRRAVAAAAGPGWLQADGGAQGRPRSTRRLAGCSDRPPETEVLPVSDRCPVPARLIPPAGNPSGNSRAGGDGGRARRPREVAPPGEAVKQRQGQAASTILTRLPRAEGSDACRGGGGRPREGAGACLPACLYSPAENASTYLGCAAASTATSRSLPPSPQRPRRASYPLAAEQEAKQSRRRRG